MIKQKQLVPKRRFEGFNEEWNKLKLGNLGSVAMNKRIFKKETSDVGEIPFYKIGTFGKEPDAFISRELFEEYKTNYEYPQVGDILISASGSIGRTVEYTGKDEYFQDSNIVWLKHGGKLNNLFLKQFYKIVHWEGLEGSTIKRLYNQNILNTKINVPSLKEQQKIGEFFKHLDEMIALEQRKIDKTLSLKSAYLAEMFPAEGERVPKRRFAGFTGEWHKRKISDISYSYSGGTPSVSNKSFYDGEIPFIRSGEINFLETELFITEEGLESSSAKLVEKGDVLYALYGATSGEVGISKINGAINQAILAIKPKHHNSYYITQWLRKEKKSILKTYLQGGQGNLSGNIVKELEIDLPSNKKEQQKIGEFFKKLDSIIATHEQKLEKLKATKQAYLHEMFV